MSCCLTSLMDTSITCHLPRPPCCGVVWGREAAASSLETPQVGWRDCSMSCLWSVKRGNVVWDLARQGMKHSTEPNPSSSPSSTTIFLIDPFLQNTRHHVFQESHVPQCRLKAAGKGNNLKSPFPFSCTVRQIETLPAVRDVLRHGLLRIKAKSTHRIWLSGKIFSPWLPHRVPTSMPRVAPAPSRGTGTSPVLRVGLFQLLRGSSDEFKKEKIGLIFKVV